MLHRLLLSTLLIVMTGCSFVRYDYEPPVTEAGRQCTVQCAVVREMCINNENYRAQNNKAACEQRNQWNYQQCIRRAVDKDAARACTRNQPMCWSNTNNFRCEENYRSCYVTCGGRVHVIQDK